MRRRLAIAALCWLAVGIAAPAPAQEATLVSTLTWRNPGIPGFGSYSGLALSADGSGFTAVSDKGTYVEGRLTRNAGKLSAATVTAQGAILAPDGTPVRRYDIDAEALATGPDGTLYAAFEANHRVWAYPGTPGAPPRALPSSAQIEGLQNNSGLEALFTTPDGRLHAIPERSGQLERPFPVYRLDPAGWTTAFTVPRQPPHLVTGADVGPDGRLYVLERDFTGLRGFASRVRSFALGAGGLTDQRTHIDTPPGRHDNLEAIALWRAADGSLRLTLLSDDNGSLFQRTEWVEYSLPQQHLNPGRPSPGHFRPHPRQTPPA